MQDTFCPGCGAYKYVKRRTPTTSATFAETLTYVPSDIPAAQAPKEELQPLIELPYRWGKIYAVLQICIGVGILGFGTYQLKEIGVVGFVVFLIVALFEIVVGIFLWLKIRLALNLLYLNGLLAVGRLGKELFSGNTDITIISAISLTFLAMNLYYFWKRSEEFF
jgi:hypothetical protein